MIRLAIVLLVLCASISCSYSGTPTGFVTQTTGVLHVYADGTSGNDAWDGSAAAQTPGTLIGPKKTLQAVFDLVPDHIKHNTCIHLAGTFDEWSLALLDKALLNSAYLVVDGGPGTTVVDNNGGANYAADINSVSTLGVTTAGWIADTHRGLLVEVVDGPAAGQTRMIQGHTTTTITPVRNWSVDPGVGAKFRIVRPATTLSASVTSSFLSIFVRGLSINTYVQRIYLSGSKSSLATRGAGSGGVVFSGVVSRSTTAAFTFFGGTRSSDSFLDPDTFATYSAATGPLLGMSVKTTRLQLRGSAVFQTATWNGLVADAVFVASPNMITSGCSIRNLYWAGVNENNNAVLGTNYGQLLSGVAAGYAVTRFGGGTGPGIQVRNGALEIGAGVDISNITGHAIEVQHGYLNLLGAVTGSSNTGAGVYAHSGSVVHIKNGAAPPTLTGTVGDLSFDGTTQASTWAAIDGGAPAVSAAELSMAKEVP